MTIPLENVEVTQYAKQFSLQAEASRSIKGAATELTGIVGKTHEWQTAGSAVMLPRGAPQSIVPASEIDYQRRPMILLDFALNLPTDMFQQDRVLAQERPVIIRRQASAAGRRIDQFQIDALSTTPGTTIPAAAANMTFAKLQESARILDDLNIPPEGRFLMLSPAGIESLLSDEKVSSSDYNTTRVLMEGNLQTYYGFTIVKIANRPEGGLPLAGNIRSGFAWQRDSLGLGFGFMPKVTMTREELFLSDFSISAMRANALSIFPTQVVQIDYDETA